MPYHLSGREQIDHFLFEQPPDERTVRDIVSRSYECSHGGQQGSHREYRQLMISVIPGANGKSSHAVIVICDTPCRGMVIVDLACRSLPALDYWSHSYLTGHETMLLRRFVGKVQAQVAQSNSATWNWSSEPPTTWAMTAP